MDYLSHFEIIIGGGVWWQKIEGYHVLGGPRMHFSTNMMTSSNRNIFRVTGPLCGDFTGQRPVTRSFDVFFDLHLN